MREPDVDYRDIESGKIKAVKDPKGQLQCSYKQRGASLGTGLHNTLEAYYSGGQPDWIWKPGQVAQSGLHLLPRAECCTAIEIEAEIGYEPSGETDPRKPTKVMRAYGTRYAGRRDLTVQMQPSEFDRLGIANIANGWLLLDYKSTADIVQYAKTAADLTDDIAACAYALDVMVKHGLSILPCRWVYFESKEIRRALAVDFTITLQRAREVLERYSLKAKHLDSLNVIQEAAQNLDACCDYSGRPGVIGCSYHQEKGGPCNARRTTGDRLSALEGSNKKMAVMSEEMKAQFAAARSQLSSGAAPMIVSLPAAGTPPMTRGEILPDNGGAVAAPKPRAPRAPKAPTTIAEKMQDTAVVEAPVVAVVSAENLDAIASLSADLAQARVLLEGSNNALAEAEAELATAAQKCDEARLANEVATTAVSAILADIRTAAS